VRYTLVMEDEERPPRWLTLPALHTQVGAAGPLAEIWLYTVAGSRGAWREDEPCADEHDAHADQSGERVADRGDAHVEHSCSHCQRIGENGVGSSDSDWASTISLGSKPGMSVAKSQLVMYYRVSCSGSAPCG